MADFALNAGIPLGTAPLSSVGDTLQQNQGIIQKQQQMDAQQAQAMRDQKVRDVFANPIKGKDGEVDTDATAMEIAKYDPNAAEKYANTVTAHAYKQTLMDDHKVKMLALIGGMTKDLNKMLNDPNIPDAQKASNYQQAFGAVNQFLGKPYLSPDFNQGKQQLAILGSSHETSSPELNLQGKQIAADAGEQKNEEKIAADAAALDKKLAMAWKIQKDRDANKTVAGSRIGGSGLTDRDEKKFEEIGKAFYNTGSSRNVLGVAWVNNMKADRALKVINDPNASADQIALAQTDILSIMKGGSPDKEQLIKGFQKTLGQDASSFISYAFSNPQNFNNSQVKDKIRKVVTDLKDVDKKYIDNHDMGVFKTYQHELKAHSSWAADLTDNTDLWNAAGLNDSQVSSKSQPSSGGGKKRLVFNPATGKAE